jgi:hypothetical protein
VVLFSVLLKVNEVLLLLAMNAPLVAAGPVLSAVKVHT